MHFSILPGSLRPASAETQDALSRLRAETEVAESALLKALLLYETGVLEEATHDDHGAARELLASVNCNVAFREPQERLAFLLERRESFKNLPRLLERMLRVAANDEERVRTAQALGDFWLDGHLELDPAQQAYESAAALSPQDTSIALSLQWIAAQRTDRERLIRALGVRAAAALDPTYRAALWLHLGREQMLAGYTAEARSALDAAAAPETPVRRRAFFELERLGELSADPALVAQAIEQQANLLEAANQNPALREQVGVFEVECGEGVRADAWLRAGQAWLSADKPQSALAAWQRARELLPNDATLLHLVLELADRSRDTTVLEQAQKELPHWNQPDTVVTLSVLAAETAAARGATDEALSLLRMALEQDPESVVPRVLALHWLLQREGIHRELAEHFETLVERLPEASRLNYQLTAAVLLACVESSSEGARALLSQAGPSGGSATFVARVARFLAASCRDMSWLEEATQRLLKNATEDERPGLLIELARSRWLAGDETAALFNLDEVSASPVGGWVAATLTAYGMAPLGANLAERGERSLRALSRLAVLDPDPASQVARQVLVATLRQLGERPELAVALFEELHLAHPDNPLVAAQLAELQRAAGDWTTASSVLATTAAVTSDVDLALPLWIQAATLCWQASEREQALEYLNRAEALRPQSAVPLLPWALLAVHPDNPEERRKVLDAELERHGNAWCDALERFALEVGLPGQHGAATAALDGTAASFSSSASPSGTVSKPALARSEPESATDLGQALLLARALWPESKGHAQALETLAQSGMVGKEIALALAFLAERRAEEPNESRLQLLARHWAEAGSLPGMLEWLGATLCNGNTTGEVEARRAIAAHLGGTPSAALEASALLVEYVSSGKAGVPLAPDTPITRLANLEIAPPGSDPRRRAHALAHAEQDLAEAASSTALVAHGYNRLLAGQLKEALSVFRSAVTRNSDDLTAWEGIRTAARALGYTQLEADALQRLANLTRLPERAAAFWRESAELLENSGEGPRSYEALEQAVVLDIRHFESFNRLFRHFRAEQQYEKVLDLAARRLDVASEPKEIAKLCWERARAHRALGDTEAALADLDTVRLLDPEHPGPSALAGEIYVTLGQLDLAAEQLSQLSRMPEAPDEQRLMSGVAAADLYENKLGELNQAVELLLELHRAGLTTLAVRERLARTTAKAEKWDEALQLLEELMLDREEETGRAEAARLALVVCRDELKDPERALPACKKLIEADPADAEALDFLLDELPGHAMAAPLLARGRTALLSSLEPTADEEKAQRLACLAEQLSDLNLRQASLGALVALRGDNREQRQELAELEKRCPALPQGVVSPALAQHIFSGVTDTPLGELMLELAPWLPEVNGPNLKSFSVGRRDRVKAGTELYSAVTAWFELLGFSGIEVYVGGADPDTVVAVPGPKLPTLIIGPKVNVPLSIVQRQALAKEAFGVATGTSALLRHDLRDVAALLVSACALGEVQLSSELTSSGPEVERRLSKELPRKTRKQLPELATRVATSQRDPLEWVSTALAHLDRVAALATGDLSYAIWTPTQREQSDRTPTLELQERLPRLLAFVLSQGFIDLRQQLGLAPR